MGDTPQPRENIINTAVSFLQNPKVQNSPVEHQQQFLKRKGLSDEEIGIAFERARIVSDKPLLVPPPPSTVVPIPGHLALPLQSKWTKVWDFFNTIMFVAGVSYSLYYLYKKFLAPLLFGKKDKKPTVVESVIAIQDSVSKSISEMKESLREVRETLDSQQQELMRVALLRQDGVDVNDVSVQRTLHDLKAEVTSIKGLLLNRKQFPSTPNPSPSIPAWQMSQDSNDNNGKSGTAGESAESSSPTSEYYKVRDLEELCVGGSNETVMINKSEVTGEGSDSSLEMVRE